MAERRMFAKTIVLSDAFLDMPLSTRCLYFTLAMVADDDGFVNNPKSIMRQVGASLDDMNVLITKKFILSFESGVIVVKHWRIHNYIQKDRYKETKYLEEKSTLSLDENGAYTECIQPVSKLDTQVRLGKDRIVKDNISCASEDDFDLFWKVYPKKKSKEAARKAFAKVKVPVDTLISAVELQKNCKQWQESGGKYIPYPATWLNQGRWEDEVEGVVYTEEDEDILAGIL